MKFLVIGTTHQKQKRVNVDFPAWMVASLDKEARRLGVTRQPIINSLVGGALRKNSF